MCRLHPPRLSQGANWRRGERGARFAQIRAEQKIWLRQEASSQSAQYLPTMVSSTVTTTTAAATQTTEFSAKSTSSAVIAMQCIVIVVSFLIAMAVEASVMLLMLMSGPFLMLIELVSSVRRFLCNMILPEIKKEKSTTCAISGRNEETLALYNGPRED